MDVYTLAYSLLEFCYELEINKSACDGELTNYT